MNSDILKLLILTHLTGRPDLQACCVAILYTWTRCRGRPRVLFMPDARVVASQKTSVITGGSPQHLKEKETRRHGVVSAVAGVYLPFPPILVHLVHLIIL